MAYTDERAEVERLRDENERLQKEVRLAGLAETRDTILKAEVERLREDYETSHRGRMHALDEVERLRAEVERLREALRQISERDLGSGRPALAHDLAAFARDALTGTPSDETL